MSDKPRRPPKPRRAKLQAAAITFFLVAVCLVGAVCAATGLTGLALGAEKGSPPARRTGVDQRVAVKATCTPTRVRGRDELIIDIQVVNTDRRPLRLARGLMVGATLHLTFTDQNGKEVEHRGLEFEVARSDSKSAFLTLKPGGFMATRLRLLRQTSLVRTYYVLRGPDTRSELHRYFLGPQGRYTLVVEYANGDDGRLAGIDAWTGVARSPKIHFALPQEKGHQPVAHPAAKRGVRQF